MGVSLLPGDVQESLELFGIVHAGRFCEDFFQDRHFDRKIAAAVDDERLQRGVETPRAR